MDETPFTVFIIQSKLIYLNTPEGKRFINSILPLLAAVAEEREFLFIFSDVQKISDGEQNSFFNNNISTAFLLDNVAEFAGERGQKTIFGNMDVITLSSVVQHGLIERGRKKTKTKQLPDRPGELVNVAKVIAKL